MPDTDPCSKGELLTNAAYICVTYSYYLQEYEGLWVDFQRLMDGIHIVKYDIWGPHVIVSSVLIFMGGRRVSYVYTTPDKCNPVRN